MIRSFWEMDYAELFAGPFWRFSAGKRGVFLHRRLVESGGGGINVRALGANRSGEMRITRFLRNRAVSIEEIMASAAGRTASLAVGRHIVAIQDTTSVRTGADGTGLVLHPTIAVERDGGTLLGLIHAEVLERTGGGCDQRKQLAFCDKQSRRWLTGCERAGELIAAGAASVTVVADREGDIYEDFALRPANVDLLIRAGQNRRLAGGGRLFSYAGALPQLGHIQVDIAAAPGRKARQAQITLRAGEVIIERPKRRAAGQNLPKTVTLTLVEAIELNPPSGAAQAHWRLLTTHRVCQLDDARTIIELYRQRWTIEQLFRTLKTRGFDIERLRIASGGPFEKLLMAGLVAAITVMQLVHERDGCAKRQMTDAFDPADRPALEAVSTSLEGKTQKQKNPHPKGSLAFAAWVFARLGGWTGYYGKPGPIVMFKGLIRFNDIKQGMDLLADV